MSDDYEDGELGLLMEDQINTLAATFYQMQGRIFDPSIDFRGSSHPEEVGCWNKSIAAHAFINGDAGLLKFQGDSKVNMLAAMKASVIE